MLEVNELTMNELAIAQPNQIWFQFDTRESERAWAGDGEYTNAAASWNAYLNRLCLNILTVWLEAETSEKTEVFPSDFPPLLKGGLGGDLLPPLLKGGLGGDLPLTALPSIWEFVNGTAIQLGDTRLILVPSDTIDIQEFCVPAEWIDIPSWAGNYYLAVQVNPDEGWLRVWGYATHQQLKCSGIYDSLTRTYSLERDDLIEDINVMLVARELCLNETAAIEPLPTLSSAQAETLLAQLSQPRDYSPRLDVGFKQWAALLENPTWRQQLYARRLSVSPRNASPLLKGGWGGSSAEGGWGGSTAGGDLPLSAPAEKKPMPASVRGSQPAAPAPSPTPVNLRQWLQKNFVEAVKADWQDIESFLAPEQLRLSFRVTKSYTRSGEDTIEKAKLIDLGMEVGGIAVVMLMALAPEDDNKIGILVEVHPTGGQKHLPHNLKLALLSASGKTLQQAQSRVQDDYIQLRYFKVKPETQISIQVTFGDRSVTEQFKI